MSLTHLRPYAENHAIQQATFTFEWQTELSNDNIRDLKNIASQKLIPCAFTSIKDQNTVTFNFAFAEGVQNTTNETIGGFVCENFENGIPVRILSVTRQNLTVIIHNYSRWLQICSDVTNYLSEIFTKLISWTKIASLNLQYNDLFIWENINSPLPFNAVLKEDSKYLPSSVFSVSMSDLWHSHHGYFSQLNDSTEKNLLENVNVSILRDHENHQVLQIVTSHRLFGNMLQSIIGLESTLELFNLLHIRNKDILKNVLTESVCQKISLE